MTTANIAYGTIQTPTFTGLNGLASGNYATSSAIDNSTLLADDFFVEVTIADIAEAGNKQVLVFVVPSLDGVTFGDASIATNLRRLGFVDMNGSAGPIVMPLASVAAAFGGVPPRFFRIVVFNDAGVALASSGNSARVQPITFTAN